MKLFKFGKKKEEEKKPVEQPIKVTTPLEVACNEANRSDLYDALSHMLLLNPSRLGKKIDELVETKNPRDLTFAANIALFEGDIEKARMYFNEALNLAKETEKQHYLTIVQNFDDVAKIARNTWEKEGAYKIEEKKS
ncbi:MAG: hypothetical protein OH319_03895 [Candidatus Parvarchaeota archaeon]|nr:hypothetical protein [Candidatus Jingweiarchaeum tengchongense]MCW1298072.1 hypothetical protein [Candidatus Jingweiarchaeum tengchongense]MCW1300128.1 hypothetical protein [Candidatus Jingweiarchaeum tengchongense]MCW1309622.1 hypothetical protein [Candidatus Jingweiarchaeum tengchongense]MCW1310890.1 hypothetical protein [Candidatus Jingweiarchaeum tengchongense]